MTDIPGQVAEVEKFSPHSYNNGDTVHLVMSEETLVLTFQGEKHDLSDKLWRKYGRLAKCQFVNGNKCTSCLCMKSNFSIGDKVPIIVPHQTLDFGPIEKILHIPAN